MKHPALATLLYLCLSAAGPSPRFQPEEGLVLAKTFRVATELEFASLTSTMNGQPVPAEYLPTMEMRFAERSTLVVSDEYVAVGEGWPRELSRRFDSIEAEREYLVVVPPTTEESGTTEGASELEGRTVVFRWEADEGEFEAAFGDDGSGALPDGLVEDLDLRGFLPPDGLEPEEGAAWEVDAEVFLALSEPGGDLEVVFDEELPWEDGEGAEVDGELTVRLARWREDDGRRLAVLEVAGTVTREVRKATDLAYVPVVDGTATEVTTTRVEVAGLLRWDVGANHVDSLELECPVTAVTVTTKDEGQEGPEFSSTLTLEGTWSVAVEVERDR